MNRKTLGLFMAAPIAALLVSAPADARKHRRTYSAAERQRIADRDHGNCLRFNKTTGAIAGAVAGGLLGRAIDNGGSTGTVVGAAAGGLAGHSLARNGRKRC